MNKTKRVVDAQNILCLLSAARSRVFKIRTKDVGIGILLFLVYFLFRLPFLWQLPIFGDETLFTGWGLMASKNISDLSAPLKAGISPLFSWLTFLLLPFFLNQLEAGRYLSLISGFLTVVMSYLFFRFLFRSRFPFLLASMLMVLPIMFVYNQLGLMESTLVFFILVSLYLGYQCLEGQSWRKIIFYTLFSILAILAKTIAIISIPAILLSTVILDRKVTKRALVVLLFSVLSVGIAMTVFLPFRSRTASFLADYVFIPTNFTDTIVHVKKNLWLTWYWMTAYYPGIFLVSAACGFLTAFHKGNKAKKFFALAFAAYFVGVVITDKIYFPRHTLVFAPFLVFLCSFFIDWIEEFSKKVAFITLIIILLFTIQSTQILITNPGNNSVMAKEDTFQLYEDWTSGKELPNIAAYIDKQVETHEQSTVYVDDTLYMYGLPLYLKKNSKISIKQLPEKQELLIKELKNDSSPTFVIENRSLPYQVASLERKEFPLSHRHVVSVLRVK